MESTTVEATGLDLLLLVAVLLFSALMSRGLARIWVSVPLFLVLAGLVVGPSGLDWLTVSITSDAVHAVAAAALSTVLFSDAATTDVRRLRAVAAQPARLLTVGLLGSIALGTLAAVLLYPSLGVALALVLATILAPTDAALGAPVVSDESVPADVREVLTVESGLNDGLAVPVLIVALGWAGLEETGSSGFFGVLVEVLGIGMAIGVGAGLMAAVALVATTRRWGNSPTWTSLVPLLTAVGCYLLAEHLGGSGFIAAFVGGLVFGARAPTGSDAARRCRLESRAGASGMLAEGGADGGRGTRIEDPAHDRGLPQQAVELDQCQLREGDIVSTVKRPDEVGHSGVIGVIRHDEGEQDVRVEGDHARRRAFGSGAAASTSPKSFSRSSETLTPPERTSGGVHSVPITSGDGYWSRMASMPRRANSASEISLALATRRARA